MPERRNWGKRLLGYTSLENAFCAKLAFASFAETREQLVNETAHKDAQEYFDSDVKGNATPTMYVTLMLVAGGYARGAAMGHGFREERYKNLYLREFMQVIMKRWSNEITNSR